MLELSNVIVRYGEVEVIHDASIRVHEGEIVTIVGANGAGKTTMLKAISGLLRPSAGDIRFLGDPIGGLTPDRIVDRGIAYVPEGRRLFPVMSVLENLEMGAYVPRARKHMTETLEEVYALFPVLKERREQKAGTLSGGQQQMVTIGRGLMSKPRLLLLDEPSLGLAPNLVMELFSTVQRIREQGTTVLLVEQNVQKTLSIADRAYVLENGRIVLEGTGAELLRNPHVKKAYLGI